MIRNPFLLTRLVVFLLLACLNIISLTLAACCIRAAAAIHAQHVGPYVFAIINSCTVFFFLFVATAEMWKPEARTAQVRFECIWTFVLSILQFVAAMFLTFDGSVPGPTFCYAGQEWWVECTVYIALVQVAWLSATILMTYTATLVIMAILHGIDYPAVWAATVYRVPWFVEKELKSEYVKDPSRPKTAHQLRSKAKEWENPVFRAEDKEHEEMTAIPLSPHDQGKHDTWSPWRVAPSPATHHDSLRPAWAKEIKGRRGIDPPFVEAPTRAYMPRSPPALPPKTLPLPSGLNGGDLGLDDQHSDRISYAQFPSTGNYNRPVGSGPQSKWIPADPYPRWI